jgi:RimJ/RimL family protein N-acetyltransferase
MLTGKLVRLRPYEMADLDRVCVWVNDPEVATYMGGGLRYPMSRAEEEDWLTGALRRTKPPEISFAIETLAEARHIGSVGLHEVKAEDRKAILGIMIGEKDCWSQGYGTDAILTVLRFAFDEMNLNRVELVVHDDNARAIACYRKCGFVEEGRLRQDRYKHGGYHDTLVMGVLADEFRALELRAEAASADR